MQEKFRSKCEATPCLSVFLVEAFLKGMLSRKHSDPGAACGGGRGPRWRQPLVRHLLTLLRGS